mgnify:CR=1 FL=1
MKVYIRVGTEYFKEVSVPLMSGDSLKSLIKWSKQIIIDDFGKNSLKNIKKYESFCTFPSHTDYKMEINNFYNNTNGTPVTHSGCS